MTSRQGSRLVGAALLVLGAAAAGAALSRSDDSAGSARGASADGSPTSLAAVRRRSLSTRTQLDGRLGYAGAYAVLARASGTVTWLPKVGQVIREGAVLFRVDEKPVVLLYGSVPAYRDLAGSPTAGEVTGGDVAQLNHDLVALGYVHRADVEPVWAAFNWATSAGVERLQAHLGIERTGTLDLGDVVFLPGAARVTRLRAGLGGPAAGLVLQASSTHRTVTLALSPDLQTEVKTGDRVTITLPDGRSTPGTVTSVGRVASTSGRSGDGPTVPVQIRPVHPTTIRHLDQAAVEVAITDRTVRDALAVPVSALLSRSGSGYAVEVVRSNRRHHLVRVTPGLFDDAAGMVQVSGRGLAAGQQVVVPG